MPREDERESTGKTASTGGEGGLAGALAKALAAREKALKGSESIFTLLIYFLFIFFVRFEFVRQCKHRFPAMFFEPVRNTYFRLSLVLCRG